MCLCRFLLFMFCPPYSWVYTLRSNNALEVLTTVCLFSCLCGYRIPIIESPSESRVEVACRTLQPFIAFWIFLVLPVENESHPHVEYYCFCVCGLLQFCVYPRAAWSLMLSLPCQ